MVRWPPGRFSFAKAPLAVPLGKGSQCRLGALGPWLRRQNPGSRGTVVARFAQACPSQTPRPFGQSLEDRARRRHHHCGGGVCCAPGLDPGPPIPRQSRVAADPDGARHRADLHPVRARGVRAQRMAAEPGRAPLRQDRQRRRRLGRAVRAVLGVPGCPLRRRASLVCRRPFRRRGVDRPHVARNRAVPAACDALFLHVSPGLIGPTVARHRLLVGCVPAAGHELRAALGLPARDSAVLRWAPRATGSHDSHRPGGPRCGAAGPFHAGDKACGAGAPPARSTLRPPLCWHRHRRWSVLAGSGSALPRPGRAPAHSHRGAEGPRADRLEDRAAGRCLTVPGQCGLCGPGAAYRGPSA